MTFMTGTVRAERDWDSLQFRAIFAICLPVSLFMALFDRFQPHVLGHGAARRSVFAVARESAGTIARYALAG